MVDEFEYERSSWLYFEITHGFELTGLLVSLLLETIRLGQEFKNSRILSRIHKPPEYKDKIRS